MSKPKKDLRPDYPPEVVERRMTEILRRACNLPASYNLQDDEKDPAVIEWRAIER